MSDLLRIIADADLGRACIRGRTISGCRLKAVLIVIAAHQGVPLSRRGIADRCCCNEHGVQFARLALIRLGVVRAELHGRVMRHRIDVDRLKALATKAPTVQPNRWKASKIRRDAA